MFRISRVFCNASNLTNYVKNSGRTLYTLNSLGVDGFIEKKEKVQQYFLKDSDVFREKMRKSIANEATSMIFSEDLKNMLHLVESNEEDIRLLEEMLRRFQKQSKETRFGNFIFGPVVMRSLYQMNRSDIALKWFKDPEFDGFFDQLVTYQILCDMLYENGQYEDVIDVYQRIQSKHIQGGTNPRYVVTLVFASCYKQNTPEAFKYCSKLFMDLSNVGHIPVRRAITFAAALALRQNAPDVALEIIGTVVKQNYVTVRNIKIAAYAQLGRPDDALAILKGVLEAHDSATRHKHTVSKESLNILKEAANKTGDNELIQSFKRYEKLLVDNGQIDENTLDYVITTQIDTKLGEGNWDKNSLAASYNNNNRYNQGYNRNQNSGYKRAPYGGRTVRSGLTDMD